MNNTLSEYMINETAKFSSAENNPLVYILIIPKLLKSDIETVQKDETVKNAVDKAEKFVKDLNDDTVKVLRNNFRPYAAMDLFKRSTNYKATFDTYLDDIKCTACQEEKNFMKCMDLDRKFTELYNSTEFQIFKNTL